MGQTQSVEIGDPPKTEVNNNRFALFMSNANEIANRISETQGDQDSAKQEDENPLEANQKEAETEAEAGDGAEPGKSDTLKRKSTVAGEFLNQKKLNKAERVALAKQQMLDQEKEARLAEKRKKKAKVEGKNLLAGFG